MQLMGLKRKLPQENGQAVAEYGFAIALLAVFCLASLAGLSQAMQFMFNGMINTVQLNSDAAAVAAAIQASQQTAVDPLGLKNLPTAPAASTSTSTASTGATQVAGSLGSTSTQLLANSSQLVQLAQQYQETNPAMYNEILQLAQKGMDIAAFIQTCAQSCSLKQFSSLGGDYYDYFTTTLPRSSAYQQLSAQDQKLIQQLATQSDDVSSALYKQLAQQQSPLSRFGLGSDTVTATGSLVEDNSNQIQQCGEKLACNSGEA